jgi:hypothetical protein
MGGGVMDAHTVHTHNQQIPPHTYTHTHTTQKHTHSSPNVLAEEWQGDGLVQEPLRAPAQALRERARLTVVVVAVVLLILVLHPPSAPDSLREREDG